MDFIEVFKKGIKPATLETFIKGMILKKAAQILASMPEEAENKDVTFWLEHISDMMQNDFLLEVTVGKDAPDFDDINDKLVNLFADEMADLVKFIYLNADNGEVAKWLMAKPEGYC